MIIHKRKTILFLIVCVALIFCWISLFLPRVNIMARIFIPLGCFWLTFYCFTNSLRIDSKGITELYSIFQKELWIAKLFKWEKIDFGVKSFSERFILIIDK